MGILLPLILTNIVRYDDVTDEFVLKSVLLKKWCNRIKRADIVSVIDYIGIPNRRHRVILITTVPFEDLTRKEKLGESSDRVINLIYSKRVFNFVKSFWDGEIERREYDFMTD